MTGLLVSSVCFFKEKNPPQCKIQHLISLTGAVIAFGSNSWRLIMRFIPLERHWSFTHNHRLAVESLTAANANRKLPTWKKCTSDEWRKRMWLPDIQTLRGKELEKEESGRKSYLLSYNIVHLMCVHSKVSGVALITMQLVTLSR